MIRSAKRLRLCTVLLMVNLAVIWGNSLLPGSESGAMSGGMMEVIRSLLGLPESAADMLHHLVRKMAHFTEFACLGALLGMAAAVADESIQLLTPDRGPSLVDVWIDESGVITGLIMVLIGHYLIEKRKTIIF